MTRSVLVLLVFSIVHLAGARDGAPPNIVVILADDLGSGDRRCLSPDSKIPTPNVDRLAAEGVRFSDAHSPSAVCTPTRYGLLTGRDCWRSRLKSGVLGGYSQALLESGRETVASFVGNHGYHSGGSHRSPRGRHAGFVFDAVPAAADIAASYDGNALAPFGARVQIDRAGLGCNRIQLLRPLGRFRVARTL